MHRRSFQESGGQHAIIAIFSSLNILFKAEVVLFEHLTHILGTADFVSFVILRGVPGRMFWTRHIEMNLKYF